MEATVVHLSLQGVRFIRRVLVPALERGELIPFEVVYATSLSKVTEEDIAWAKGKLI